MVLKTDRGRTDPLVALHRRAGIVGACLLLLLTAGAMAWRYGDLREEALADLARIAGVQRASLETALGYPGSAESGVVPAPVELAAVREVARALLWQWTWPEGRVQLVTTAGEEIAATSAAPGQPLSAGELATPATGFMAHGGDYLLVQPVRGTDHRLTHTVAAGPLRAVTLERLLPDLLVAGAAGLGLLAAWLLYRRRFVRPASLLIEGLMSDTATGGGEEPVLAAPWDGLWAQGRRRTLAASEADSRRDLEEARLSAAIQAVDDGVLIVDQSGRPVTVNDAMLQALPPDAAGIIRRGESLRRPPTANAQAGSSEAIVEALGQRLEQTAVVRGVFVVPLLQGGLELEELPTTGGCRIWITRAEKRAKAPVAAPARVDGQVQESHGTSVALMGRLARELADPLALLVSQTRRLRGEATEESMRFRAERAQAAAERCADLVETCRAIAGDRTPRFGMVLADALVEQVLQREAPALEAAAIDVARGFAPNPPPVWADAGQLDSVFTSLLDNARDALSTRPQPRKLTVRMRRFAEQLLIDFEDNGPGIAPTIKGRLLEPFATTKGDRGGTGLGLAYCRGIMGLHGGSMEIDQATEGGTKVTLGLPIRQGALEPTAVTRLVLTPPAPGRARIASTNGAAPGRAPHSAPAIEIAAS